MFADRTTRTMSEIVVTPKDQSVNEYLSSLLDYYMLSLN